MRTILRNVSWIGTCDDAQPWLENGHVSVLDGCIELVQAAPIGLPAGASVDLAGCLLTCQVAYAVSSIFGTSTYGFYVPLFTALTCALQRAAQDETGIVA